MWTRLRSWVGGVVRRKRVERDLVDEVEFHLRERADHWVRQGFPPEEAARRARVEFGAVERHKEDCKIGLRMALGADRREVAYMVLRESLVPVMVGLAFGLGAVVATTRFIQSMLFGLTPHDAPTILLAALGLIVSALLAAWLPSRRASGIDPMAALRCE